MSLSSCMLANYCLAWGLHLRMMCFPQISPWRKVIFSVASEYQLKKHSGLGLRSCLPYFCFKAPSCSDPCRLCACCLMLCEFLYGPSVLFLDDLDLLLSTISSDSCSLSVHPATQFIEPWGEGFAGEIPFRAQCSKVSH